jgi:DNA-binding NarL/FixJ family response regulator
MIRVLIVEDQAETRAWLQATVSHALATEAIETAATWRDGLYAAKGRPFDIALIDVGLPDGDGVDLVARVKALQPDLTAIVATVMGDDATVVRALAAGADGYLLKDTPEDLFSAQLAQTARGLPALSPSVARRIMEHYRLSAAPFDDAAALTPRERDVLRLIGEGRRNAEVARALGLTDSTVASYVKAIYAKLGISNRAEAALKARQIRQF